MTPRRLVGLECPRCHAMNWMWHSDHTGMPGGDQRRYYGDCMSGSCLKCGWGGGLTVSQQSPPEFILQPHSMYPMSVADFAYWIAIVKEHFPDDPRFSSSWYPGRPGLIARLKFRCPWKAARRAAAHSSGREASVARARECAGYCHAPLLVGAKRV